MNQEPSRQFVVLIALMTSFIALAIDAMLPALPMIASGLGAPSENDRQLVVSFMFLGLAFGQLAYGPISDTVGRKPAVYAGFFIFIAGCLVSIFATSFAMMLAGRVLQGVGAAGPRIVSMAIVRDRFEGRAMARVMSLINAIFIMVPVFAPGLGQLILLGLSWHWIFVMILALAAIGLVWFWAGMDESLPEVRRRPFALAGIASAFREAATTRRTAGYTLAGGLVFGSLIGYLNSSQQIFGELYGLGPLFPLVFGVLAVFVGAASFVNSKLVMRLGMRLLSRRALEVFSVVSILFALIAYVLADKPPLWLLLVWLAVAFAALGILFANFNALAMEPVGHIAGTAAALIGFATTLAASVIGGLVGRAYDGTVLPIAVAFALLGLASLGVMAWTERKASDTR